MQEQKDINLEATAVGPHVSHELPGEVQAAGVKTVPPDEQHLSQGVGAAQIPGAAVTGGVEPIHLPVTSQKASEGKPDEKKRGYLEFLKRLRSLRKAG